MIPIDLATTHLCVAQQCLPVSATHYKGFTTKALRMKALHRPDPVPPVAPETPSGGASGGGGALGGEGAPGSGTGLPGHIIDTGRF